MSTFVGAHVVREHITSGRFAAAVAVLGSAEASYDARKDACELILDALKKAKREPERANGFLALIPRLITWGYAGLALEAIDSVGTDSAATLRLKEWQEQIETLVARRQEAIRQNGPQ